MMEVRPVTEEDIPRLVNIARVAYGDHVKTSNEDLHKWASAYLNSPRMGCFCTENGFIVGTLQIFAHEGKRRTVMNHLAVEKGHFDAVFLCRKLLNWTIENGGIGLIFSGRSDNLVNLEPLARRLGGKSLPTWIIGK